MTKGCLVVHGLTGTPATVSVLCEALLAAGYRVAAPCLAGHGGSLEELSKTTWHEWYNTVRIAFGALRREVDRIYYAGTSLGALLGLKLAQEEGWGVRALALLSTPLKLALLNRMAAPAVRYSPLRYVIKMIPKSPDKSVANEEGRRRYEELSLPMIPAQSVYQIMDLQKDLRANLHRVSSPVLLAHGGKDLVAPTSNVRLVKKLVASDIVETALFRRSRHVLTMDWEKEEVARTVVDFFKKFA